MAKTAGGVRTISVQNNVVPSHTPPKRGTSGSKSTGSKSNKVIESIKHLAGIDLNKYRDDTTRRFDKRNAIYVDWKSMSPNERNAIQRIAYKYKHFEVWSGGAWMNVIKIK